MRFRWNFSTGFQCTWCDSCGFAHKVLAIPATAAPPPPKPYVAPENPADGFEMLPGISPEEWPGWEEIADSLADSNPTAPSESAVPRTKLFR
jgi:hypothetical protein